MIGLIERTIYCVECGNSLEFVLPSTLYDEYYFCNKCSEVYEMEMVRIPDDRFEDMYSDRRQQMKDYARAKVAKREVTNKDLVKLGYLKDIN